MRVSSRHPGLVSPLPPQHHMASQVNWLEWGKDSDMWQQTKLQPMRMMAES